MSESSPKNTRPRSHRRGGRSEWFDEAAGLVVSTSLAALGIALVDQIFRPQWEHSWADHWKGAPILYFAPGALAGLLFALLLTLQQGVTRKLHGGPRTNAFIRAGVVASVASAGAAPAALMTFNGSRISSTWLGEAGPPLFLGAVFMGVFALTLLVWRGKRRIAEGKRRLAGVWGATFVVFGFLVSWIDMRFYVGLYDHLHALLEFCAFVCFAIACQIFGFALVRAVPKLNWFNRAFAVMVLALGLTFVSHRPLRTWTDARLAHAWVEEYYVGRALRRAQLLEIELTSNKSFRMARLDHIHRRFQVKERDLEPSYLDISEVDASALPQPIQNVVFFFVDTLRADVAEDARIMPHLSEFRREALDFRRAYATGSDTLRSLPTITRGNYFLDKTHEGDLLRLAQKSGRRCQLIAPKSASDFLAKMLPTFSFDAADIVQDYEEGEKVWGYGAHSSTAREIGDRTDAFLKSSAAHSPFFLWLFHFDAHAWRELDEDYIEAERDRLDIPRYGEINLRYRVIARSIDEQLGRLLRSLEESGKNQDTAVVFLSDHGEGLGQNGFWVHSIFLWESLVRVPLVMRLPGVAPARVDRAVSLVDLAPTLAPILGARSGLYHGENLVHLAQGGDRRLPILLRGGKYEGHDRVGIVDEAVRRKLVLRLEAAFVELYDYERDAWDKNNLARTENARVKKLVQILAQSPVFPKHEDDFLLRREPEELSSQVSLDAASHSTMLSETMVPVAVSPGEGIPIAAQ